MMYRYQPPKSSIWGHKLRKMPADRARRLLEEFISRATGHHEFRSASLSIMRDHPIALRFAEVLGMPSVLLHERLTHDQSNACLQEIMSLESSAPADARIVLLNQCFEVSQWAIDGRFVATRSKLNMHYGAVPCLTTRLWFETEMQFNYIRDIFNELGLCRLNKQHLRSMKPSKV
jgi:hypothetical protein